MNSYNLFDPAEPATIQYRALATSEQHVRQLAHDSLIDIDGMVIELDRTDVRNEIGNPYSPSIKSALVV